MEHYDSKRLNQAFTALNIAVALLLLVVFYRELRPEWYQYQKAFNDLAVAAADVQLSQVERQSKIDQEYKNLLKKQAEAQGELDTDPNYLKLVKMREDAREEFSALELALGQKRLHLLKAVDELAWSTTPKAKNFWTEERHAWEDKVASVKKVYEEKQLLLAEIDEHYQQARESVKSFNDPIAAKESSITKARASLDDAQKTQREFNKYAFGLPNQLITKYQIFLPELTIQRMATVDRCMVCHIAIDKPEFANVKDLDSFKDMVGSIGNAEKAERYTKIIETFEKMPVEKQDRIQAALKPHPRLDELFKHHPIDKFGCTPCHHGQGTQLTAKKAHAHPEDVHHWETPFLPVEFREAVCGTCHRDETELAGAPVLSKGRQLFEMIGCTGCHPHGGYKDVPKMGPALNHVAEKFSPEWTHEWLMDPKAWSEHTRMPAFFSRFDDAKNDPEVAELVDREAWAITAYLISNSQPLDYKKQYRGGNKEHGKELVQGLGCLGCHEVGGVGGPVSIRQQAEDDVKSALMQKPLAERLYGPELTKVAQKIGNSDWLFNWLLNPKDLLHNARMPSLRLSEAEAADITAFLLTLHQNNPEITLVAQKSMPDISDKTLQNFGRQRITYYGCFGCHDIPGVDGPDVPPDKRPSKIGKEFDDEGRADLIVPELDWGRRVLEFHGHDRKLPTWLREKIDRPRDYRDFDPEQGLRMPVFSLSDEERTALTTALLSFNTDHIHPSFMVGSSEKSASEQPRLMPLEALKAIEAGRRIVRQNNCGGCHLVELPNDIPADDPEDKDYNYAFALQLAVDDGLNGVPLRQILGHQFIQRAEEDEEFSEDPEVMARTMAPPLLLGEGRKVNHDWLFNFLKDPTPIRVWLKARMPTFQFDDEDVNKLVRMFGALSHTPMHPSQWEARVRGDVRYEGTPLHIALPQVINESVLHGFDTAPDPDPEMVLAGKELLTMIGCFRCHPTNAEESAAIADREEAPNFALAGKRLDRRWVLEWLKDPVLFQPRTNMPNAFGDLAEGYKTIEESGNVEEADKVPPLVRDNYEKQIEALRDYLLTLEPKQAP